MNRVCNLTWIAPIFILLVVAGCRIEGPPVTIEVTRSTSPTNPELTSAVSTSTATVQPTPNLQEYPADQLCPDEREVEPRQLSLEDTSLLIVESVADERGNIATYSLHQGELDLMAQTEHFRAEVSPDGQWVAYSQRRSKEQDLELWIVSVVDKSRMRVVDELPASFARFAWVDNNHIILWFRFTDTTERREGYGRPTKLVNPFNLETTIIPEMPRNIRDSVIWIGPQASNAIFVLEEQGGRDWVIYDMQTGTIRKLFPWQGSTLASWTRQGDKVAVFLGEITIIDVQSREKMKAVELAPLEKGHYGTDFLSWSPDGHRLAFKLAYHMEEQANFPPEGLYVYDEQTGVLYDYCLPLRRSILLNALRWSPDGNFLAWAVEEPDETFILEIESGRLVRLPGLKLIGWGTVNHN